jgi:hypothetical protein
MVEISVATSDGLHAVGRAEAVAFKGETVNSYVREGSGAWAITEGTGVWRRGPDGWKHVTTASDLRLNCLLPGKDVLVGTAEAHLHRLGEGGLQPLGSFDQADGRDDWYTPWGGPPDVRSITRGSSGSIYANVHVGGVLRSEDDGSSWTPTIDIHSDVHEVRAYEANGLGDLVLAATAWGLALSEDGARAWGFDDEGLHASYARAVGLCNGRVLMSSSVGPHGGRSAIYRRALGRAGFSKCEDGLPEWFNDNIDTGCLATEGTRAAFGTSDGRVFLSEDEGSSWSEVASGLPPVRAVAFE